MDRNEQSVLVSALPPATDYLTYLTILEYNLEKSDLPLLHSLLQDSKLVINIGWDLVQLLLPLLPESRQCLEDVASLGNPREVILKVTEELLKFKTAQVESSIEYAAAKLEDHGAADPTKAPNQIEGSKNTPSAFETLIQMLCILHPRIRTKKPSRFLENSISAIIAAYGTLASSAVATRAVLTFLNELSGSSRPCLPPRSGELPIPTVVKHSSAPDPEDIQDSEDDGETVTSISLLQALAAYQFQLHLDALGALDDSSPMRWTERYVEARTPERFASQRKTATDLSKEHGNLKLREALINQMLVCLIPFVWIQLNYKQGVAVMKLQMDMTFLRSTLLAETPFICGESQELSDKGILYMMSATLARHMGSESEAEPFSFPEHDLLTTRILGDPQISFNVDIPPTAVDAILRTGWASESCFDFPTHVTHDAEVFNKYLQKITALAATQSSQSLRYHSYLFATHILQSNPISSVRVSFIQDTLRSCPYPNLREVAVGWLKNEFASTAQTGFVDLENVFNWQNTLKGLALDLFGVEEGKISPEILATHEGFYQASLGLLYFLCSSQPLCEHLNVAQVLDGLDVEKKFLTPLEIAMQDTAKDVQEQTRASDPTTGLEMLGLSIDLARQGLKKLNFSSKVGLK